MILKDTMDKLRGLSVGLTRFKDMQYFLHLKGDETVFWNEERDEKYTYCIFKFLNKERE